MNKWTAYGAIVSGLVLLALYLSDTITTVPYAIFAVMAGGFLVVDGTRRLLHLRRTRGHQSP